MTTGIDTVGKWKGCKVCGEMLQRPVSGRPKVTCGPECARVWANCKRRASRARSTVLEHLEQAAKASNEVGPLWERVQKLQRWVDRQEPARLAEIMERDIEHFDTGPNCTWPKSAL
jgi:hypothetical protein